MSQLRFGDRVLCKPNGKVGVIGDIIEGTVGVRYEGRKVGELYFPRELEKLSDKLDAVSFANEEDPNEG